MELDIIFRFSYALCYCFICWGKILRRNRRGDSVPLSGREHAIPKLGATAHGPYKLSVPSALLGNYTPNAPARASDYPPKRFNLGFPPNQSKTLP
jgi:hypothetical protein